MGTGFTSNVTTDTFEPQPLAPGAYRYGFTDNLELQLLSRNTGVVGLAYRFDIGPAEVRLDAGVVAYLSRSFRASFDGDPRESLSRHERAWHLVHGANMRVPLRERLSALFTIKAIGVHSSLYGSYLRGGFAQGTVSYDHPSGVTCALAASISDNRDSLEVFERVRKVTLGGLGLEGRGALLAYSPTEHFDVLFAPFVTMNLSDSIVAVGTTFGLDLHWD